jgi:hypothetical protein
MQPHNRVQETAVRRKAPKKETIDAKRAAAGNRNSPKGQKNEK